MSRLPAPLHRLVRRRRGAADDPRRGILITGGGTAGHTNPGIAVAQALVEQGLSRDRIHFVGGVRGNEGALVSEAGVSIDLIGIIQALIIVFIAAPLLVRAIFPWGFRKTDSAGGAP